MTIIYIILAVLTLWFSVVLLLFMLPFCVLALFYMFKQLILFTINVISLYIDGIKKIPYLIKKYFFRKDYL